MANIEAIRKLLLLADVPLGTCSQEEQQGTETTPEDYLPQERQQVAHTTLPDNQAHDDEQPAQVSPDQGLITINSATAAGKFAAAHAH